MNLCVIKLTYTHYLKKCMQGVPIKRGLTKDLEQRIVTELRNYFGVRAGKKRELVSH